MLFIKWIKKGVDLIKSCWHFITTKFFKVNSFLEQEKELDLLLSPLSEITPLYEKLNSGKDASELFAACEKMARNKKISREQWAKANLVLSILYQENINQNTFSLKKDPAKSLFYRRNAECILAENSPLSPRLAEVIACIKLGGEAQYAYKILTAKANTNEATPSRFWSQRILAYVFRNGLKNGNFNIPVNTRFADHYDEQTAKSYQFFQERLTRLTKSLLTVKFSKERAYALIKKIADSGSKIAQYHYARFLDSQKKSKESLHYYQQAAEDKKATPFMLKTKGLNIAKKYLVTEQSNIPNIKHDQTSHYRFQIALDQKDEASTKFKNIIFNEANQDNLTAILQAGLCSFRQQEEAIEEAEKFFKQASQYLLYFSPYDQKLFEKLTLNLAGYYEDLLICLPGSLTQSLGAQNMEVLKKVLFYLQHIPSHSSKYEEAQFKIAHFQKYFLHNYEVSAKTFYELGKSGDDGAASLAFITGLQFFWKNNKKLLSQEEQQIVTLYEKNHPVPLIDELSFESLPNEKLSHITSVDLLEKIFVAITEHYKGTPDEEAVTNELAFLRGKLKAIMLNKKQSIDNILLGRFKKFVDFADRFDSQLKPKFSYLWTENLTVKNKVEKDADPLINYRNLLYIHHNFLSRLQSHSSRADNLEYFHLIEKNLFNFLKNTYTEILDSDLEMSQSNHETNEGLLVYAK